MIIKKIINLNNKQDYQVTHLDFIFLNCIIIMVLRIPITTPTIATTTIILHYSTIIIPDYVILLAIQRINILPIN